MSTQLEGAIPLNAESHLQPLLLFSNPGFLVYKVEMTAELLSWASREDGQREPEQGNS